MSAWFANVKDLLYQNFVSHNRYLDYLNGLKMTLEITLLAALLGIAIGILVAAVRSSYDKNHEALKRRGGFGSKLLSFFNFICNIYLTLIRGTPTVVQLLIVNFVILASSRNTLLVAVLAFGFNSGAYVAEIFRSGIMAVDEGQFEAGRSLGFNYAKTMWYIILPQMFKIVLPTLLNEFITLLKETAVAGYVGITDLTRAGDQIRGSTFVAWPSLFTIALMYLIMVMILTAIVRRIERRLRSNER